MRFNSSVLTLTLVSLLSTDHASAFDSDIEEFLLSIKNHEYGSSMTRPPTPRPSCKPGSYDCPETDPPTLRPKVSDPPSESPSEPPTPVGECDVKVTITCLGLNEPFSNMDCMEIPSPNLQCSNGSNIDKLSFSFIGGDCSKSANTQDDEVEDAQCEDFGGVPSERSRITCVTEDGVTVFNQDVSIGEVFDVPTSDSLSLSDLLICDVFSSGEKKQTVQINTDGKADLFLKDIYGSLQVESCGDKNDPNPKNCMVDVEYTYTIDNVHPTSPMDVTSLNRTIFTRKEVNGVSAGGTTTEDLIDRVDPAFVLPDETTTVKETVTIDLCVEGEYETSVIVKADPPEGKPCESSDKYTIVTKPKGCRVDVEIACEDEEGTECSEIDPIALQCSNGEEIDSITFEYIGGDCDQSTLQADCCKDFNGGPSETDDGRVLCVSLDDDEMVVAVLFDKVVSVGDMITIPSSGTGPLSRQTMCEISEAGVKKQELKIGTSGDETDHIFLRDVCGSLQVEGCGEKNCIIPITYTYTLKNVGQSSMDVTTLDRTRDGVTLDFLDDVEDKELDFGEMRVVPEKDMFDLCSGVPVVTVLSCEADPPIGEKCTATDEYLIYMPPGSCRVDVEITCVDDDGNDCDELVPPPLNCNKDGCVDAVSFTYTGSKCKTSAEDEKCEDFNDGPSISSRIICANADNTVVFRDTVVLGDKLDIPADGESLSDVIKCDLYDTGDGQKVQELEINVCEDLYLTSDYGSLRLDSCDEKDCFVDITYTYLLKNIGVNSMEITELLRTNDGNTENLIDLIPDEDKTLDVGTNLSVPEEDVLNVCVENDFCVEILVEADPPEGIPCLDSDKYCILVPVSSEPSAPPSESPSEPPSPSPSDPPSPSPSDPPSPSPSDPPSPSPSDPPTPVDPSSSPSEPPTPVDPSPSPSDPPSPSPSESPTNFECSVDVKIGCTTPILGGFGEDTGQFQDCSCAAVTRTKCIDRPTYLKMRYNGGNCLQSDNIQNNDLFQCFDFQGGAPVNVGDSSFITVKDIKGGSVVYHAAEVKVGEEYVLEDPFVPGSDVEANMNISIYSSAPGTPETLLQTLVFHSSCSQNLFLKDRFGASQLVEFENPTQGLNSCQTRLIYDLNVGSDIKSESEVILDTFFVQTNEGPRVFDVRGQTLSPGESLDPSPTFEIVVDLAEVTDNQIFALVTANNDANIPCNPGRDTITFTTGLVPPPNVPTRSPTPIPTISPAPTPDPESNACALTAFVQCDVTNQAGFLECENIVRPSSTQCVSGGNPSELEFVYEGGDCSSSTTTQPTFTCTGNADLEEVWITISSANNNLLFNRVATRGSFIDLRGVDTYMDVTIYDVDNGRRGDLELQRMNITSTCVPASDLRLLATFGSLKLIEFTSDSVNAAFANVEIEYAVQLEAGSTLPANILFGVQNITVPGGSTLLPLTLTAGQNPIGPRDTLQFVEKTTFTIDLINGPIPPTTLYSLFVEGRNVNGAFSCNSTATDLNITITDGTGVSPCIN